MRSAMVALTGPRSWPLQLLLSSARLPITLCAGGPFVRSPQLAAWGRLLGGAAAAPAAFVGSDAHA